MPIHGRLLPADSVVEEGVRIERFFAQILPGIAVKLVGTALAHQTDDRAPHPAVFGRVVVRDDLEFLDGLRSGVDRVGRKRNADIVGAVEVHLVAAGIQAAKRRRPSPFPLSRILDGEAELGSSRGEIGELVQLPA